MDEKLVIGGFLPTTTIDYPGHLAAVVFCQGCPWRCRYCHNNSLTGVKRNLEPKYTWSKVVELLKKRAKVLDGVVFSGGEPTLQKGLESAINEARSLGYKIGLHTGGQFPERLKEILPIVDWVGLDIKTLETFYQDITGVGDSGKNAWESLEVVINSGVDYEVRTTVHSEFFNRDRLLDLAKALSDKKVKKYVLQICKNDNCLDKNLPKNKEFFSKEVEIIKSMFPVFEVRGN